MPDLPNRRVLAAPVTIAGYDAVLDRIDAAIAGRERIYVCCAPASTVVAAGRDGELRQALEGAAVVTADGMGVVWAARLLGEQQEGRVYGPELMLRQCDRAARQGQRIWLYGGFDDATLAALREALAQRFPGIEIAGSYSPPHRPLSESETADVVARINADAPDVVWVGIGSPRQEIWMHELRSRLEPAVLCGVGAAFDFHAGRVPQAPGWMQRAALEWLYRLAREPRRLGPRYLKTNPAFIAGVARQVWRERAARARATTN